MAAKHILGAVKRSASGTLLLIATFSAGTLSGQSASYVPIPDLIRSSDVIVVASVIDEVRSPGKTAFVLRVDRPVKGIIPTSQSLAVEILKSDNECVSTPPLPPSLLKRTGLFFLDRRPNGAHRINPVQTDSGAFTAAYYRIPAGPLPREYAYVDSDPVSEKVLLELAAATEYYDGSRGFGERLLVASSSLYSHEARRLFERFSRLPSPNMRVIGLAGLVREGDVDALLRAEEEMQDFSRTAGRLGLLQSIHEFRATGPVAINALARIANDQSNSLYVRYAAASALARIGKKEVLPHLAELLRSDSEALRDAAASGFSAYASDIRFEDSEMGMIELGRDILLATADGAKISPLRRTSAPTPAKPVEPAPARRWWQLHSVVR